MKNNYLYLFAIILVLGSCEKNTYRVSDRTGIEGKALIKVGLFNMTQTARSLLIYNNGVLVSGPVTPPYPYPGSGLNTNGSTATGDYFAVNPGANKYEAFTFNPGTSNTISKVLETTQTLEANKKYTLYSTDTAANTVYILAPDEARAPDSGKATIRFINLIPDSDAAGGVDFYQGNTLLKAGVKYKSFTDFFEIPATLIDTFSIRLAGTAPGPAVNARAYYRLTNNTNQRIYSFLSRGYLSVTGTTDLRRPSVSAIINQ